ncbi:DUF2625 family protein [Kribbella sindirgiensis]|uniref:DUF2625 family protein n=1 Tax=Kribbella sindirgiensis TaxID=1124744 RepID=UPI00192D4E76|nr:DUF2625 family protein [Kribbella sindirgiensis]
MTHVRNADVLADVDDPAWTVLQDALAQAARPATVLPVDPAAGRDVLFRLQVTARSMLGALAVNCGGLVIDEGWLRILGGGGSGLPDLATANDLVDPEQAAAPPPYLIVAYDVLGGRFAVDGGGLGVQPGQVCYWAPDTLEWDGLGVGHTDFVLWSLTDGPTQFYAGLRWPTWLDETRRTPLSEGIAVYPPLFSAEAYPLENTSRKAVPFEELLSLG